MNEIRSFKRQVVDIKLSTGEQFECDYNIAPLICAINEAGLQTVFCCEGHIEEDMCAGFYVAINVSDFFNRSSIEDQINVAKQIINIFRDSQVDIHDYIFDLSANIIVIDRTKNQVTGECTINHTIDFDRIDKKNYKYLTTIKRNFVSIFDHIDKQEVIYDVKLCIRSSKLDELVNFKCKSEHLLTPKFDLNNIIEYRNNLVENLTKVVKDQVGFLKKLKHSRLMYRYCEVKMSEPRCVDKEVDYTCRFHDD